MFLALVLKEGIREFLPQRETEKNRRDRAAAEAWIFDTSANSRDLIFGFEFICEYLGIDPEQARARILKLKEGKNRRVLYTDLARIGISGGRPKKFKRGGEDVQTD